jgi:hypothetical protein
MDEYHDIYVLFPCSHSNAYAAVCSEGCTFFVKAEGVGGTRWS